MQFKTIFIINRIVAPVAFGVVFVSILLPPSPLSSALRALAFVPLVGAGGYGAYLGFRLQRELTVPMRCPICGRVGICGRGVTLEVGWWLRCEDCGIVRPHGLLGLSFSKEPIVDDHEDEDEDER